MPKKVCEHMQSIASTIRPEHKIHGCYQREWLEELKKGKSFSSDLSVSECGDVKDNKFLAKRKDGEAIITYLSDISSMDYNFIKLQVEKCNCENVEDLKKRISELESSSSTQLVLRRSAETEKKDLEVVKRSLERENSRLERQIGEKNDLIKWGKDEVGRKNTEIGQLKTERDDYKDKWVLSEAEVRRINQLFNNLQIENSRNKDKIRELKGELGQSREEYLNQKIGIKLEKLETLAQQLGINQGQITNLRNAYQQLIEARRNFNQANINAANANVNNLRAALATTPTNRQKLCHKCEKLVKLEIELNQVYQEQYEARQEVPPRN